MQKLLELARLMAVSIVVAGCAGADESADREPSTVSKVAGDQGAAFETGNPGEPDEVSTVRRIDGTAGLTPPVASSSSPAERLAVTISGDAIQPHMVIGELGIYVVFIHKGNIAISTSSDEGRSFSPPVIAIDAKGRARGGAHRGPRIGVDAQNRVTVTAPLTFDDAEFERRYPTAELFFARSTDGGKTWSQPVQVNEVSKKAPEALHWMAVAPSGEAHVAWLDMRGREQSGQDIYYARLADGKVGQNQKVASEVCECCAPGMTVDAVGNPFLAFREGGDKQSREIFARRSTDGGRNFAGTFQVNRTKTLEHG